MTHINTLLLHRLRLGELAEAEALPIQAHLAACALCAARAQSQVDTRRAFNLAPMPQALLPRRSLWERVRLWLPAAALVPAVVAGAFVLRTEAPPALVLAGWPAAPVEAAAEAPQAMPSAAPSDSRSDAASDSPSVASTLPAVATAARPATIPTAPIAATAAPAPLTSEPDDGLRSKGVTPRLEAWVQTGDSARPLYTGEALGSGSRVQLRYDSRGRKYVTFAGRDTNGLVEVYGTVAAGEAGLSAAPFALTLDKSPGDQAFFALCTNQRPDPDEVMRAVGQNPVRMEGALVASVVVRKE